MAGFSRQFDASYRDAGQKIYKKKSIGSPSMVRSDTCDLRDETGFFVRYASRNGGIFVDCAIHDKTSVFGILEIRFPRLAGQPTHSSITRS